MANRYSKALKYIKKDYSLTEAPTNSMSRVYSLNEPGHQLGPVPNNAKVFVPDIDGNWPAGIPGTPGEGGYTRPAGFWSGEKDWDTVTEPNFSHESAGSNGTDTSGLIAENGAVLTALPPNSRSFILGPLVDGHTYLHGSDAYTNIGYIQKDTRQFVLLARVDGQWESGGYPIPSTAVQYGWGESRVWDGTANGFTAYNSNFTLEMAQWFRGEMLGKRFVKEVAYFYSGGVAQPPINNPPAGGMFGGSGVGAGGDGSSADGSGSGRGYGQGGEPNIGEPQQDNHGNAGDANIWGQIWDDIKRRWQSSPLNPGNLNWDAAKDTVRDILDALPAVGYSADIAASVVKNEPVIYDENDIPKQDIKNYLNNIDPNAIGNSVQINNGPVPYADENIYKDESGKVHSNIGPNGEKGYYQSDNTGQYHTSAAATKTQLTAGISDKLAAAGNAQLQVYRDTDSGNWMIKYEDHAYHNLNSADPGEVPDPVKAAASNAIHNIADAQNGRPQGSTSGDVEGGEGWEAATPDNTSANTGGMSDYPCNSTACIRGDVQKSFNIELNSDDVPQAIKDAVFKQLDNAINMGKKGKSYGVAGNLEGGDYFNQGISNLNKGHTWGGHGEHDNWGQGINNSYELLGKTLSESRKIQILKEIKKPVVLIEASPKMTKLKGYKPNFKGKFSPQNTPEVTACPESDKLAGRANARGQTWRTENKYWQGYETTERMNIIYDRVGHGQQAWDAIIEDARNKNGWKNREIQEQLNQIAHEKAMRKIDPDFESPWNLNEMEDPNKDEIDKYMNDPLVKRVRKKLITQIDYKDKPSKKGYPEQPPVEIDPKTGMHPKYGKTYKYDKLDPVSAVSMRNAPTGNPEIDANVEKAAKKKYVKPNVKEEWASDWRDSISYD